jgi:hypothetical protein
MATTNATLKRLAGGRDVWGGHGVMIFLYTGPTSYQGGAAGGDIIDAIGGGTGTQLLASNTGLRTLVAVIPCVSASGTYAIEGGPAATLGTAGAARRFLLRWRTFSTGAEVANTTNLSAETAILCVIGD